ncbi:MAG TPA: hypothetical protein PLV45_16510, partial [bacterium]|nr:hypothetical protein [bacterium]
DVCISFPLLYTGHINRHPKVMTWQSPHLTVTSEPPVAFQVDGEVCGVTPVKLSLIRHAFFAVAPGSGSSQ